MKNDKKIDILYQMDNMVEDIKVLENLINESYSIEKFILKLSFENTYNKNEIIIRFNLSNTIGATKFNNGILTFYHKFFYCTEIENYNENDIILKFFSIQNDLKDIKLSFEISDNRNKEN